MRNFRLVRRVGREELGTGKDVGNDGRTVVIVRTAAGKNFHRNVQRRNVLEIPPHLDFRHGRREVIFPLINEFRRDIGVQVLNSPHSDPVQHLGNIPLSMREIGK